MADARHRRCRGPPTSTPSRRTARTTTAPGTPARRPASSACSARREVPIGLLSNGTHLRLVYAPRGESSGHLTFPVAAMLEVAGPADRSARSTCCSRPSALFTGPLPEQQRLPALLARQPQVPERRLDQARRPGARGPLRAAARLPGAPTTRARASCSREVLREAPAGGLRRPPRHAHAARLRPLRRGPRPAAGERRLRRALLRLRPLRAPARRRRRAIPDTMDQRYGAWAQLLALFRLVHDGAAPRQPAPARRATAASSTPTPGPSSKAAPTATSSTAGDRIDPPARPRRRRLPRAREPARPRRRAPLLPRPRRRADRLRLRGHDGLRAAQARRARRSPSSPTTSSSTSPPCWPRSPPTA